MSALRQCILVLPVLLLTANAKADSVIPKFELTLAQAQNAALATSNPVAAGKALLEASEKQSQAARAGLWPRLSLEASYAYQTEVPNFTLPGGVQLAFGTHSNYSVGPTLSYTLFDHGGINDSWKGSQALGRARGENLATSELQVKLALRLSYFRLQLALKNLELTSQSLKLAQAQSHDILNRFKAGAASRLDQISAHREILSYELKFDQSQNEVSGALRELITMTNDPTNDKSRPDTSRPVSEDLAHQMPSEVPQPSLVVRLDALEDSIQSIPAPKANEVASIASAHPDVKALSYAAEASMLSAQSQSAAMWPKIQLQARAYLMYPDVMLPQNAEQNSVAVSFSLPLFDDGLNSNLAAQKRAEAKSLEMQRNQKMLEVDRDWHKLRDLLASLRSRLKINEENVSEAKAVATLTYKAYQAGKVNYLDVESANLKSLESQIAQAQLQEALVSQLAQLDYLEGTH